MSNSYKMKDDLLFQNYELQGLIRKELNFLNNSKYFTWTESSYSLCTSLQITSKQILQLKDRVQNLIYKQLLLSNVHDLLGCASPILLYSDINFFIDLDNLQKCFYERNLLWTSVHNIQQIRKNVLLSRLGTTYVKINLFYSYIINLFFN